MSMTYTVSLGEGADVPMSVEQISAAYSAGTIKPGTLLWREGMEDWQSLDSIADELGIVMRQETPTVRIEKKADRISLTPRQLKKAMLCTNCGHVGKPKWRVKGSLLIEILLWCSFLVPGIIYSIWRYTTERKTCACCGSDAVIPTHSPKALAMLEGR